MLSACSKEEQAVPDEEKRYSVRFTLKTLSHDMVPISGIKPTGAKVGSASSDRKLSDAVNYLFYYAFNERGTKVHERTQYASEPGFGQIDDMFGKGKYTVLVVGRTHPTFDLFWDYNDQSRFYTHGLVDEVFFKRLDLVVTDSEVEQDIVLQRKGGMVEIETTGNVPLNVGEIRYSITGVSDYFIPKTSRGNNDQTFSKSMQFHPDGSPYTWNGEEPNKFHFFLDEDKATKVTVRLSAFDRNQQVVAVKVIENVPVAVNKKTKLRGRLFDDTDNISAQTFSVSF